MKLQATLNRAGDWHHHMDPSFPLVKTTTETKAAVWPTIPLWTATDSTYLRFKNTNMKTVKPMEKMAKKTHTKSTRTQAPPIRPRPRMDPKKRKKRTEMNP